jgi:hypothetical protein
MEFASASSSYSSNGIRQRKCKEHLNLILNEERALERYTLLKGATITIAL